MSTRGEDEANLTKVLVSFKLNGLARQVGILILPATLEIIPGGGNSSEVVSRCTWGMSERGSKAWSEFGERSCGSSGSM